MYICILNKGLIIIQKQTAKHTDAYAKIKTLSITPSCRVRSPLLARDQEHCQVLQRCFLAEWSPQSVAKDG